MSTITRPQSITGGPKHVDREKTDGLLRHTRLANEPHEYLQKREELRLAEMEMFRNIERVAALRRALPVGAEVADYLFQEGPRDLNASDSSITRDATGTLRHFYTTHPWLDDDVNERGIDLVQPVYNMLDLTPQGRGSWYASLNYGTRVDWSPAS